VGHQYVSIGKTTGRFEVCDVMRPAAAAAAAVVVVVVVVVSMRC